MKNKVFKVLTEEHGKKVIDYFKSLGIDTCDMIADQSEQNYDEYIYYGVIDNKFSFYNFNEVNRAKCPIIEIPEKEEPAHEEVEKSFPRVMLVSNDNINWFRREVFMKKCSLYLAWSCADPDRVENCTDVSAWNFAKEVVITAKDIEDNFYKVKMALGYKETDYVTLELNK